MCSTLDIAASVFIYLGAFLMIYAFVAVWIVVAYDRSKKTRASKDYIDWLGI